MQCLRARKYLRFHMRLFIAVCTSLRSTRLAVRSSEFMCVPTYVRILDTASGIICKHKH